MIDKINDHLLNLVQEKPGFSADLYAAARYALSSGGKRLRPSLTLMVGEAMGAEKTKLLDPACAVEFIHTYSLIHDDLPCMDDDDLRRGKPTLHRVYNEGHAVLVGDFLLTFAFETLTNAPGLSESQKLALITTLAKNSGGDGLIGGQVVDINTAGKKLSLDTVDEIHLKKTARLITCAILFGAIIADAPKEQLAILEKVGDNIGVAFQIIDDVLDITAGKEKHGQSSDLTNDKSTYATLLGVDEATKRAEALTQEAIERLHALPYDMSPLIDLAKTMVYRKK